MRVTLLSEFIALAAATGCLPCALQTVGSFIPGFSFSGSGQASGQAFGQVSGSNQARGSTSGSGSLQGSLSALISAEIQPYGLNCQVQGQPEIKTISINADGTCGIQGTGTEVAFTFGQAFQWATGGLVCSVDREGGPIVVKPLKDTPAMNIYHGWQAQAGIGGEVHFAGYDNYICHDKICAFPTGKPAPSACTATTVTTTTANPDVQPPPAQVPLAPLKSYTGHPEAPTVETTNQPPSYESVPGGTSEAGGQIAGNYSNGSTTTTTTAGTDVATADNSSDLSGGGEVDAEEEADGLSGLSSSNLSASSLPANRKLSPSNGASGIAAHGVWSIFVGIVMLAIVV